jgi:hypothetical protein
MVDGAHFVNIMQNSPESSFSRATDTEREGHILRLLTSLFTRI